MFAEAIKGFEVQGRVVKAVILREMRTRFGAYSLGYLWAIIVPLLFILVLTAVYSAVGRNSAHGAPMEVLLLSGMMAWLTFSDTLSQIQSAFRANRPLLVYPMVTVFDIAMSRALLELLTKCAATIVLMVLYMSFGIPAAIDDPLGAIIAVVILCYLALVFGHAVACLAVILPSTTFIVGSLRRVMFFTSGALFLLSDVPAEWRSYLLYNPVAHAIDMMRGAWIAGYSGPYFDAYYVGQCAILLTAAAAIGEATTRRRRGGARQ